MFLVTKSAFSADPGERPGDCEERLAKQMTAGKTANWDSLLRARKTTGCVLECIILVFQVGLGCTLIGGGR